MMGTRFVVIAAMTITLPIGDCVLDSAIITNVPPNTLHVVAYSECGAIKCWDRWIETDGKRIGKARACTNDAATLTTQDPVVEK